MDTDLHHAISTNNFNEVQRIIEQPGFDINAQMSEYGGNPLQIATEYESETICTLLINHCANVNAQDNHGRTALHVASLLGYKNICAFLLKNGANINAQDIMGATALHFVSANGYKNICAFLLKNGAEIDRQDNSGHTALHLASYNRHTDICAFLLKNGADITLADTLSNAPLYYATPALHAIMTQTSSEFQSLCHTFDVAITNASLNEWDVPGSKIELRCAVYNKYLKIQCLTDQLYSASLTSFLKNHIGTDIASLEFVHHSIKAIYLNEMSIYSNNCYELFQNIVLDGVDHNLSDNYNNPILNYILTRNHNAIDSSSTTQKIITSTLVQNKDCMTLIFSYLTPDDVTMLGHNDPFLEDDF